MIDVKAARNAPDEWRSALARKGADATFDAFLEVDRAWLDLVPKVDDLRSQTKIKGKPTPEQLEALKGVKAELQQTESDLAKAEAARQAALDQIPNPPDPSAPDGDADEDAVELKRVGEPPTFGFEVRDHLDLGVPADERVDIAFRRAGDELHGVLGEGIVLVGVCVLVFVGLCSCAR